MASLAKASKLGALASLAGARNISRLGLNGTLVADQDLAHLKQHRQIERLNLNGTAGTDVGLAHVAKPSLVELHIRSHGITDRGQASLRLAVHLERLDLSSTRVGSPGLRHLANLTRLEQLSLVNTNATDDGLELRRALPEAKVAH